MDTFRRADDFLLGGMREVLEVAFLEVAFKN